jgi:hypothetical protein
MQEMFKKIGSWLFLIGILVSVIVGLAAQELWYDTTTQAVLYPTYISITLAALGFVVGILSFFAIGNITKERVPTFLIAAVLLLVVGASSQLFNNLDVVGTYFANIATTIAIFAAPAAGLLAIRAIWDAGKTEDIEKVIPKIPK